MENGHALKRGIVGIKLMVCLAWIFACDCFSVYSADILRVAAYNVENYLAAPTETRPEAKSDAARAKVRESIRAAQRTSLPWKKSVPATPCSNCSPRSSTMDSTCQIGK